MLVKRIYAWTDMAAARHPGIDFLKAGYLSHHPLVIETFLDRLNEAEQGSPAMNCQFCKYREQAVGYEARSAHCRRGITIMCAASALTIAQAIVIMDTTMGTLMTTITTMIMGITTITATSISRMGRDS